MKSKQYSGNCLTLRKILVATLGFTITNQSQFSHYVEPEKSFEKIRDEVLNSITRVDTTDFTIQDIFKDSEQQVSKIMQDIQSRKQTINSQLNQRISNLVSPNSNINAFSSDFPFNNPSEYGIYGYGSINFPTFNFYDEMASIDRKIDGSKNNINKPYLGKKNTALSRIAQANYKDGISQPHTDLPNPRDISNSIGKLDGRIQKNKEDISMAFTIWGQFLDHDLDLTEAGFEQEMPIPLRKQDPFYNKQNTQIPFRRSKIIDQGVRKVRKHPNQVTTWIDGSQIYGSDEKLASELRTFKKGKLKTSQNGHFLPIKQGLFLGGDIRVNQNVFLTIYHTIFVREHNRLCDTIASSNPKLSDQQIYQSARNYVIGLLQKITYQDFLPKLLGKEAYYRLIGRYRYYNKEIDPSIAIEFSTAAFRIGHPLLASDYAALNYRYQAVENFKLKDLFFNPNLINKKRFPQLLLGLMNVSAKQRSQNLIDDVRNFLIAGPNDRRTFLDLFSLNIQRGRDHGLPFYNEARIACGLKPYRNFEEFFDNDREKVWQFKEIYGDIDKLELWIGIISEKKVRGAVLGQLGIEIVGDTFRKVRDGDRFWYENAYPNSIVSQIQLTQFSDIIRRTIPELFFVHGDIFQIDN